jgi:hypothetical protein
MRYLLRIYTIRPGEMARWVEEWRTQVVPLRRRLGFEVLGGWASEGTDTFAWLLAYAGDDLEAATRAYYESPERRALDPDPARHIAEARELEVEPVPLDG